MASPWNGRSDRFLLRGILGFCFFATTLWKRFLQVLPTLFKPKTAVHSQNSYGCVGDGLVLIKAADDVSFEKLYEPLLALPGVEYVGPNFVYSPSGAFPIKYG